MAVGIVRGGTEGFGLAFAWMIIATIIDATDGALARKAAVRQVLPEFDGRRLDDLTDFLTYTFLPLLLLWRAEVLPAGHEGWLLLPLLASAYGFCQADIKTADGYFLGFPSLWNVVAFYLYLMRWPAEVTIGVLVVLSILTFVPSRYLYPSQPGRLNAIATMLGVVWAMALAYLVIQLPALEATRQAPVASFPWAIAWGSLAYPSFYLAASWWKTFERRWTGR